MYILLIGEFRVEEKKNRKSEEKGPRLEKVIFQTIRHGVATVSSEALEYCDLISVVKLHELVTLP